MNNAARQSVAVIGAGPAGMTAAFQLARAGGPVDVYEAAPQVGGLARTISLWGQKVDLGPHRFFSKDRRVNQLWLEVVGKDYSLVRRLTRVYYRGRFFHYPLQPLNVLANLGPVTAGRCVGSYLRQKLRPANADGSFESWVVQRFGQRLFDIFFKTYSEKLWGIPCAELDSDFAAQRLKTLTLLELVKDAFGWRNGGGHRTLADQFAYPHGGTGMIYERMAQAVAERGDRVLCSTPVRRVTVTDGRATGVELPDGTTRAYDHVISTMPLTLMVSALPDVPRTAREACAALKFRNTILVYLRVEATDLFPDNWIYIHSPGLRVGRITNFRNWVPQLCGEETPTILALEFWCNDEDALWTQPDDALIDLAKQELHKSQLAGTARVSAGHVLRIRRCYPVYRRGYKDHVTTIEEHLRGIANLQVIGRYGAFKYNNQDHSILMGMLAAENILHGKRHDLWQVNSDFDEYQEASIITETGLLDVSGRVSGRRTVAGAARQ